MKRIDFRDLQKYLHEIPNSFRNDELLQKIHSMDAYTAYALLGGYLAPLLSAEKKERPISNWLQLEEVVRAHTAKIAQADLKDIYSRIPSILPQLEVHLKELLTKLKEYQKKLPRDGRVDRDGHYDITKKEAYEVYREIYRLVEIVRNLIRKVNPEDWEVHPELRKKYNEIITALSLVIRSEITIAASGIKHFYVLPPEETKLLIQDVEKALRELYESRKELEERSIRDLEERLNKLVKDKDKEIGGLDKKVKDLTDNEKRTKERIAVLERKLQDLESERTKGKNTLLEKNREIEQLNQKISDLLAKNKGNEKTIVDLREEIKQLNRQVSDFSADKAAKEQIIADLKEHIKKLNRQVSDLSKNKTGNEKTIDDLNKRIKDLHKKISELTGNQTGKEKTIAELNERIRELTKKISTLEGKKEENTSTISELTKRIRVLEKEKATKDTQISTLQKRIQEAKDELVKVVNAKNAAIEALKEQIEKKEEEVGNLRQQINHLEQKIKDQKNLEKQITLLQKEKEELEKKKGGVITDLKGKLAALDEKIRNLEKLKEAEITALQKDLQKVREDLQKREKEIRDTKIDEVAKDLPDLEKLLKDLEKEGIDLKDLSKLRDKIDDLKKLTKDGKDAVNDLGDLQKKINDLREELKKQKLIELEKQKKEKEISDRENKLDDLQLQIVKLRRELKDLENLKGKDLTTLREKLEKLEKLNKEAGDSNDKIKALEEEVNKLRRELNKDKQEEIDRQKEIREREKEIERKKKEEEINKIKEIELEELKKKRGMMDAYVFMIVVFLTQLHTRQAEKLKTHGETLKKISQIFNQWNVIQRGLNTISQNATTILRWIKEGKVDSNYNLYTDNNLSKKETDSHKLAVWEDFKSFLPNLQKNIKELRRILDEVRSDLPDSAKTLLDTMYKLSGRLLDIPDIKSNNNLSSYLKVTTQSDNERKISQEIEDLKKANKVLEKDADTLTDEMRAIRDEIGIGRWHLTDDALKFFWPSYYKKKQQWNAKYNKRYGIFRKIDDNNKRIQEKERDLRKEIRQKIALPDKRLTILEWISDSDQTQFKAYMDNLAQGVTALTSISNMAQQELQIDTQYYNSLLGLQKAGMDSLNRTIQGIIANMK